MKGSPYTGRLISLIFLLVLTLAFYFIGMREDHPSVDRDLFRVEGQEKVDRVVLESDGGKVELTFDGTRWRVNGKFDADRQLIQVLFATLDKAEPKRQVSSNLSDSIRVWLGQEGVRVNLFQGGQLEESFLAGGNTSKTESWFAHEDGPPYVMVIPGYRAYVSYVLELDEYAWRDKRIFNFNWRNFKSLTAAGRDASERFEVTFKDRFFTIPGLAAVDTTRLNNYLDAVSLLAADQIMSPEILKSYERLFQTDPSLHLEVKDIADNTYTLELWPPLGAKSLVAGRLGSGDGLLFSVEKIVPIARKKKYFEQPPGR